MKAIQDFYPPGFAYCYGCGVLNPQGHHLKSYFEGDQTIARFLPDPVYSGGVPGHVYGGMVASLIDCHGNASAAAFGYRHDGREMGDGLAAIRFVTASLKVDFRQATPLGVELVVTGRLRSLEGRKAWIDMTLAADGRTCAVGEMLAIRLPDPPGESNGLSS